MNTDALEIDLIYDIICPWCYIGHQRLTNAIQKTKAKVQIRLVPFQIRPNLPEQGISIKEYWKSKGIDDPILAYKKVSEAALAEGLEINPEKFTTIPNTLKIHQVILKAEDIGVGLQVLHAIQTAYFSKGVDISLLENILKITKNYLLTEVVTKAWNSELDIYKNLVLAKEKSARDLHVNAVPTYIVDHKHRISGAVSNFTLMDMLQQLAPKEIVGDFCDIKTENC
ncbi:putative DsbA family dithiol-disulfide isomerase [Wenyingzhuangia heitensis]|uniref:DsbA family dithiol-disulfide isomerase n=1 Tax=Wenyingzhuangia heitensis TaxID=1487859 RepID=A0ABX0UBH5_9FLAO|nr:DsbA family oxidoreductase [Wenyingzhuangia heitensis]NIJ45684.1 putative DsbA family dithiol-disulfide isomerase [Wenyingzhuangia heitensis]